MNERLEQLYKCEDIDRMRTVIARLECLWDNIDSPPIPTSISVSNSTDATSITISLSSIEHLKKFISDDFPVSVTGFGVWAHNIEDDKRIKDLLCEKDMRVSLYVNYVRPAVNCTLLELLNNKGEI